MFAIMIEQWVRKVLIQLGYNQYELIDILVYGLGGGDGWDCVAPIKKNILSMLLRKPVPADCTTMYNL